MRSFVMFLTYARIIFGPIIFITVVFFEAYLFSFFLFLFAALTDFFDGFMARKFNVETRIGKLLDPIADKILLCSSVFAVTLALNDPFVGFMAAMTLIREFWVAGIREHSAIQNKSHASEVTFLAKVKTSVQFFAIAGFFVSLGYELSLGIFLCSFAFFLSLLISIKTALDYTRNIFIN